MTTTVALETPTDELQLATCPFCHTPHAWLTPEGPQLKGDDWRCVRCGQGWNGSRLETVAGYDAWVAGR